MSREQAYCPKKTSLLVTEYYIYLYVLSYDFKNNIKKNLKKKIWINKYNTIFFFMVFRMCFAQVILTENHELNKIFRQTHIKHNIISWFILSIILKLLSKVHLHLINIIKEKRVDVSFHKLRAMQTFLQQIYPTSSFVIFIIYIFFNNNYLWISGFIVLN